MCGTEFVNARFTAGISDHGNMGPYADELDIPMSDVEEEWLEDLADNE